MRTLKLTAKDFKKSDSYWSDYIGTENVADFDGHIEIEGSLGYVKFVRLNAKGHILAEAGTGITASWSIKAGTGIEAGTGIKAGTGIEAGWSIKAGTGIEAGTGITAGLSITCKLTLKIAYRVFAGICYWREEVTDADKTITCGKFEGGEVAYGILKETGLPEEKYEPEIVERDGKKFKLIPLE